MRPVESASADSLRPEKIVADVLKDTLEMPSQANADQEADALKTEERKPATATVSVSKEVKLPCALAPQAL